MSEIDTIAAIATPPGEGGIAIVRVSGPRAKDAFEHCFRRRSSAALQSHRLYFGQIVSPDGTIIDEALAAFMAGPRSYTAEDVCELHCHGGTLSAQRALRAVVQGGMARLAEPGEFTRRAFVNGRIDLSEAEAVMALIQSGSEAAARSAVRQMEGGVSRFVARVRDALLDLLAAIEAGNDFPDEIEEDVTRDAALIGIERIRAELIQAADERAARIVRDGLSVALVGAPNVGKSSLMNALLRQERAIVTDIPGTTRDVLTERLRIGEFVIEISDTAGQRQTGDAVERIGVQRALQAEQSADVVVLVLDASRPITGEDMDILNRMDQRGIVVLNKVDIQTRDDCALPQVHSDVPIVRTCAATGEGIDALISVLQSRLIGADASEGQMTQRRHIDCAQRAIEALDRARDSLQDGHPVDLASVDLMAALGCMAEITGESASESVIERVFAQFCVGK